jgi:hypothetical protein
MRTTDTFLFISHTTNVPLFKFRCNIFIGVRIIKEMPGSGMSGTRYITCPYTNNDPTYVHTKVLLCTVFFTSLHFTSLHFTSLHFTSPNLVESLPVDVNGLQRAFHLSWFWAIALTPFLSIPLSFNTFCICSSQVFLCLQFVSFRQSKRPHFVIAQNNWQSH